MTRIVDLEEEGRAEEARVKRENRSRQARKRYVIIYR